MNRAIWVLGLIALVAVVFFLARKANDGQHEPSSPPPVPLPRREPGFTVEKIQCPVCQGFGYTMVPGRTGMRRQPCPFCGGKGGIVLRIPPGNVRCPDCQGFGKVATERRYTLCPRCNGRGYIKQPFQPTE